MKKIVCLIITAVLLLSFSSVAFAKTNNAGKQGSNHKTTQEHSMTSQEQSKKTQEQSKKTQEQSKKTEEQSKKTEEQNKKTQVQKKTTQEQNKKISPKKYEFKINGSPVIKYGKYKLPISPVTKGMGATVNFDKETAVLTVVKGNITVVIDFKNKTATVNGVVDTKSGIFTAKNDKKMTVLIKYIANALGVRCDASKDKVTVEVPGLDYPTNVAVTPVSVSGAAIVVNTLNSSSTALTATANVKAGQATGGKAELYVGSKLVATDSTIAATDTTVTFTTGTADNETLRAAVPAGGVVTVKLYNAKNEAVTSTKGNPTLVVDYVGPTLTAITSAAYSVSGSAITVNVTGASANGDKVDVTKVSLTDLLLNKIYQLTTASTGVVNSDGQLVISLGSADIAGLTGFGASGSTVLLNVASGSLLTDAAGNVSPSTAGISVPVTLN